MLGFELVWTTNINTHYALTLLLQKSTTNHLRRPGPRTQLSRTRPPQTPPLHVPLLHQFQGANADLEDGDEEDVEIGFVETSE